MRPLLPAAACDASFSVFGARSGPRTKQDIPRALVPFVHPRHQSLSVRSASLDAYWSASLMQRVDARTRENARCESLERRRMPFRLPKGMQMALSPLPTPE